MSKAGLYPLGTPDGNETYLGVTAAGAAGLLKRYPPGGGTGAGYIFDTKANAEQTSLPAGQKSLILLGYDDAGDTGQQMTCTRVDAMPTEHEGWIRTADRYRADGVEDTVNGGYFEYVMPAEGIRIEWFGGKSDWGSSFVPGAFTDNLPAFNKAQVFLTSHYNGWAYKGGPKIRFGYGGPSPEGQTTSINDASYYFSDMLEVDRAIHLCGASPSAVWANHGWASDLVFAAGKGGIRLKGYEYDGATWINGAQGAVLEDLRLHSLDNGGGEFDINLSGINWGCGAYLRNISVGYFRGHGILLGADVTGGGGSNANCWYAQNISCLGNRGSGMYVVGGDVNAGTLHQFNFSGNKRYGLEEYSFLANVYIGGHFDGNEQGPYYVQGGNGCPVVLIGPYTEGGQPPSYIGPNVTVVGGIQASPLTVGPGGLYMQGRVITGGLDIRTDSAGMANETIQYILRGERGVAYTFSMWGGLPHDFRHVANFGWALDYAHTGDYCHGFTSAESRGAYFGRPAGNVDVNRPFFPNGMYLSGDSWEYGGATEHRYFGIGPNGAPTFNGKALARGEYRFYRDPSAGDVVGTVTTDGGINSSSVPYVLGVPYQHFQIVETPIGGIYTLTTDTAIVPSWTMGGDYPQEPVHGSWPSPIGTEKTYQDGYRWKFVADTPVGPSQSAVPNWQGGVQYPIGTIVHGQSWGDDYELVNPPPKVYAPSTVVPTHEEIGTEVTGADGYRWRRVADADAHPGFYAGKWTINANYPEGYQVLALNRVYLCIIAAGAPPKVSVNPTHTSGEVIHSLDGYGWTYTPGATPTGQLNAGADYPLGAILRNPGENYYIVAAHSQLPSPATLPSTQMPFHVGLNAPWTAPVDGYSWRYLGPVSSGRAVFKRFGPIMGDAVTTVSDPIFNTSQTWNAAAVPFVGHTTNITDSASHANSVLHEWRTGGVLRAAIGKQGGIGLFGATPPIAQPTVSGSRGGNAALASLITALAATGIIIDNTTA